MTHKEIKNSIHKKLAIALEDFKSLLGEKKYNNRVKKAAKLIAEGLGKEIKNVAAPKTTKKPAVKKAVIPVVKKATKAAVKKTAKPIAKKTAKPIAQKAVSATKKVVTKKK
jgi:hypothetical protein